MNSEVDQELIELQNSEGCDQRIRIQLEAGFSGQSVSGVPQDHYWFNFIQFVYQQAGQRERMQGTISKFADHKEEWLIYLRTVLPFSRILMSLRIGQKEPNEVQQGQV